MDITYVCIIIKLLQKKLKFNLSRADGSHIEQKLQGCRTKIDLDG